MTETVQASLAAATVPAVVSVISALSQRSRIRRLERRVGALMKLMISGLDVPPAMRAMVESLIEEEPTKRDRDS